VLIEGLRKEQGWVIGVEFFHYSKRVWKSNRRDFHGTLGAKKKPGSEMKKTGQPRVSLPAENLASLEKKSRPRPVKRG